MGDHSITVTEGMDENGAAVRTTVESDAPTKPTKAVVGAIIATGIAVGGSLVTALSDDVISPAEIIIACVVGLTALGGVYGGVYNTTNAIKR